MMFFLVLICLRLANFHIFINSMKEEFHNVKLDDLQLKELTLDSLPDFTDSR